jgi:hypothetical protein
VLRFLHCRLSWQTCSTVDMLARFVLVKKCFLLLILPMNVVRLGNVTSKYNHFRSLDAFDSVNIFLCDGTGYYVLYIFFTS